MKTNSFLPCRPHALVTRALGGQRASILEEAQHCVFILGLSITVLSLFACNDNYGVGTQNNNDNQGSNQDAALLQDASSVDGSLDQDATADQDASLPDGSTEQDAALQQDGSVTNGQVGAPCGDVADCSSIPGLTAECLTTVMMVLNFPGGYCSATGCTSGTLPDECAPSGGECVNLYLGQYCLKPCTDVSECRQPDYDCTTLPGGQPGDPQYCLPPLGGG